MPATADLQHADLAAYALLEQAGFLSREQRDRLREALPFPHQERERRSRLYGSSLYLYLIARGVGAGLSCVTALVHVIDSEVEALTEASSPDLTDLSLLLAARIELATVDSISEDSVRRVTGRLAGADSSWEGAVVLHWLLEIYGSRWPDGGASDGLRQTALAYVERASSPSSPSGELRPVIAATLLETMTRHDPEFRLISRTGEEAAIAARLRARRWFEGAAYLFVVAVIAGWPMYAAVGAGWFTPLVGWAGALGLGVPAAAYALLVVMGRPRDTMVLGFGVSMGLLYWAAVLYAGFTREVDWLRALGGEGVLLALLPAALTSFWAGVNAARRH